MEKFIKYYTTGEFAKLCGVNKKTLFHYDDIDLLKPEKITENNYRYYSSKQLELFSVISILKDLEMPLKDIKNFLNSRDIDKTIQLFNDEKKLVEDRITHLNRIKKLLDVKLKIIDEAKHSTENITIEDMDEEIILLSDIINDTDDDYDVTTFTDHIKYCFKNNLSYGYPIGSIIKKDDLLINNFLDSESSPPYSYFFTKLPKLKVFDKYSKKPKGLYVVKYHKGYYDSVYDSYIQLLNYINCNNLIIDGNAYEEMLIDEVVTQNINDYVFKISIKIK